MGTACETCRPRRSGPLCGACGGTGITGLPQEILTAIDARTVQQPTPAAPTVSSPPATFDRDAAREILWDLQEGLAVRIEAALDRLVACVHPGPGIVLTRDEVYMIRQWYTAARMTGWNSPEYDAIAARLETFEEEQ